MPQGGLYMDLRKQVRLLKANRGITFKEISLQLGLKGNSFYNWLCNKYELSTDKQAQLQSIIEEVTDDCRPAK